MVVANPKNNRAFMQVLSNFLTTHDFTLPTNAEFQYIIDGIDVIVDGKVVLEIVDRPPNAIYEVHKTKHTEKHLKAQVAVAV